MEASSMANVGVIGAGLMGAEIAFVHALSGHEVLLADRDMELLEKAVARLATIYEKGIARGIYKADQKSSPLSRISAKTSLSDFSTCDLIVEAVFEKEDVKAEVLSEVDRHVIANAIIATNTSTLPTTVLASDVGEARRRNFMGMHFFSPVSRMKLVEVIPALETDAEVTDRMVEHCLRIGKSPVRVKDVAGFAVNRLLYAMMIEAIRLVEEGVATPEDIDIACRLGLDHPMGPFELMDATTSKLCLQVQEILQDAYGERFRPRPLLKQRVRAGYDGGRGNKGWRD